MILLTLITMGFYIGVWHILRRKSLMKLDPARAQKTDLLVKGLVVVQILYYCSIRGLFGFEKALSLCFIVMLVYAAFVIRGLLRGYAERVAPRSPANVFIVFIAASALWTFLFGFLYLQGQINKMIDARLLEARL